MSLKTEKEEIVREIIASWLLCFGDTPVIHWSQNAAFILVRAKWGSGEMKNVTGCRIWIEVADGWVVSEEAKKWFLNEQVSAVDNHNA